MGTQVGIMDFSENFWFRDWPNPDIPLFAAGVYSIWRDNQLIYCGMSGRDIENPDNQKKKKYGIYNRLQSHASGRLSGDQFCVYVANRLVIPELKLRDLERFESGDLTLEQLTKDYIHENLSYRFLIVDSSKDASDGEKRCQTGEIFGQTPFLNPRSKDGRGSNPMDNPSMKK